MNRPFTISCAMVLAVAWSFVAADEGKADVAHWQYRGYIDYIFDNDLNLPISIGTPAFFDIQFDPLTPDSSSGPGGEYRISGASASINMSIGSFVSTPINQFTMYVLPKNCCAADDQVNFLAFNQSDVFIPVDIPGLVEDAQLVMFFRQKKIPISSDALPIAPPNPRDYFDVLWGLRKGPSPNRTLSFNGRLILHVPEPSSLIFAIALAIVGVCGRGLIAS